MTISELYRKTISHGKYHPLEILNIIEMVFNISKEEFWGIKGTNPVTFLNRVKFLFLLFRLWRGEPVSYITGKREFFSEEFYVGRGVLIPRPETEILVEKVLDNVKPGSRILDIGAGSGAIGITIAKRSNSKVVLTEKYNKAIKYLKKNVKSLGASERVEIFRSDLFPQKPEKFDIIVSNPPYISLYDYNRLEKKIKNFEPKNALIGGKDGYLYLKNIIENSGKFLEKGGMLFLELGYDQKNTVEKLMFENGFINVSFYKDLSGIFRVVKGLLA